MLNSTYSIQEFVTAHILVIFGVFRRLRFTFLLYSRVLTVVSSPSSPYQEINQVSVVIACFDESKQVLNRRMFLVYLA